jgi:RNA polymerase sigma-70 factor (ECF subfamily)
MAESPEEFDALMMRVRLGDEEALSQLVRRYEKEVQRTASCLLGRTLRSLLDPADLVQSVHRTVIHGLRGNKFTIDSPKQLLALALTLTRHKVVQHARHLRCQQRHTQALAETKIVDQTGANECSPEADPAQAAEYKDIVEHLCRNLDDTSRHLVQLRLQGYSTAEVARQLGMDADILRVRLSRLRRQFRENQQLTQWI